jgi:hypothetical protein
MARIPTAIFSRYSIEAPRRLTATEDGRQGYEQGAIRNARDFIGPCNHHLLAMSHR